ncbi:hypothetical protein BH11ARM2_BH11ARM2_01660 [soil metagenome]
MERGQGERFQNLPDKEMKALLALLAILPALANAQGERVAIEKLAKDDGIQIQILDQPAKFQRDGYTVTAEPVTDAILARYLLIFEKEWRKYPRTLMVRTNLARIVLGSNVCVEGQPRAAVPEFIPGWFWLDADIGSRLPDYGRHVLHHDFFHMIDYWDSKDRLADKAWEALNPPSFHYGRGGWFAQKGNPGALRTDLPGFLDEYSESAVEEDKAEIYSHSLTSPAFIAERIKADRVLATKFARVWALVQIFEPQMDANWLKNSALER